MIHVTLSGVNLSIDSERMSAQGPTPVSRSLVKIIRDACKEIAARSGTEPHDCSGGKTLGDSLACIQERQNKEIEFYLRTCAARLGRAS